MSELHTEHAQDSEVTQDPVAPSNGVALDGASQETQPSATQRRKDAGAAEAGAKPEPATSEAPTDPLPDDLRPVEIVRRLDEYIIGQSDAKRAVAIALRNRMRRQRLAEDMRDEVLPKNILMIGPTGVGKTEIARRLARLTSSPFIKVEATKFTEVGYVGRDVESIIRDLLEQTITDFHNDRVEEVEEKAREIAEERIVDSLIDVEEKQRRAETSSAQQQPQQSAPSAEATPEPPQPQAAPEQQPQAATSEPTEEQRHRRRLRRRQLLRKLRRKQLEDREIEVEVEEPYQPVMETFSGTGMEEVGFAITDFFTQMTPPRKRMRRMTVADARNVLTQEETDRLVDMDRVYDDAIKAVEDDGIVFVDEVDKIAGGRSSEHGPDVSGEGVQRDLLPLVEGSTVHTRYGAVHTDHILFVSAGAFNVAKPSDLIPEFQGRFPIRVELKPLTEDDLQRILVEPSNALTKQYVALLATEGVTLEFSDDGLRELAHQAHAVNDQDENIGARRLFTIMEKVLEDVSFSAEEHAGQTVTVDAAYVRRRLSDLVRNEDLRRYVL